MKKVFAIAAVGLFALSGTVSAQTFAAASPEALAAAKAQNACGDGFEPRKAEFLADGRLAVLCPPGSGAAATAAGGTVATPAVLAGTGLGAGGVAALAGLLVLVGLSGGDDSSTTTTTTTTSTTTTGGN